MSSKKDKKDKKQKEEEKHQIDKLMSGVTVKNNFGTKTTLGAVKAGDNLPGQKSVKSSKFAVSKDDKTGSYCMDPISKDTAKKVAPSYTLIWLHAHDSSAVREFTKFNDYQIAPPNLFRIVILQAQPRPLTKLKGKRVPAWFDILDSKEKTSGACAEIVKNIHQESLAEQADQLNKLAIEEANMSYGGNLKRVFLGGDAEGCMVVLAAFMRYEGTMQIGGILGLNGFQALDIGKETRRTSFDNMANRMATQVLVPMMLVHGENNKKIQYDDAARTYVYFRNLYKSKPHNYLFFKEKRGTDTLSAEYQDHVRKWFMKQVKLAQYDNYWTRTWSKKFKFMLFLCVCFYIFICYIAFNIKQISADVAGDAQFVSSSADFLGQKEEKL